MSSLPPSSGFWTLAKPQSIQIYILQKESLSTPETFDITDRSLATQGPLPAFQLACSSAASNCCRGNMGNITRLFPQLSIARRWPWTWSWETISFFPLRSLPPSSHAPECPRWSRPWVPSPGPPLLTQSCLLTDPENFWFNLEKEKVGKKIGKETKDDILCESDAAAELWNHKAGNIEKG